MNEYAGIDERIIWNVKMCAKNLKRTSIFRSIDIDDIEQELMCEVISCMPKFDERKGSLEHFIRKVLARRSINLLRTFSCAKRGVFVSEYISNDNSDEKTINENIISLDLLMNNLPSRYKVLCKLLMKYSISEAAEIIGKTRATLYRDLKKIASFANCESNSEDQILSMFKKGVNMKNLSVLETSSAKEISALEVHDLMDLSDQVAKLINHAKELKEKLYDGLNLKFSEAVKNNLRSENKDTGTTRFFDGAFQIVAEVPKKVVWDAEKMEELIKRVPKERRKEFVKTTHVIEERKYSSLPHEYQELFREARTITPGKIKFQINLGEDNQ